MIPEYVYSYNEWQYQKGMATPPKDIGLIRLRLAAAERHYKEGQG